MDSTPLLGPRAGLSWAMATLCIVDMFGVFPVVALPRPIIDCGWIGLPLAVCVIGIQIHTAGMLGECWLIAESLQPGIVEQSRCPYAALAEMCFGARARCCVSLLLNLALFGGGIPNLLLASQMLQLVGLKESNYGVNVSFCYWLLILGLFMCPMMWLGSPKDMKVVAVTSCLTVVSVAVLTWSCILLDEAVVDRTPLTVTWEAVAIAYGIIAFQFDVHPMVLTVQVDMAQKKQLYSAILAAFAVSGSLFLVTTTLASWRYGAATKHNLLQGLPGNGLLYLTIVLVTLQICLSMVVGGSPLFQDLEDRLGVPREFCWRRCLLRSSVLLAAVLVAETVPRFDLVMGLLGGALTGPLMFVFPPLFYLRLGNMKHVASNRRRAQLWHDACGSKSPSLDIGTRHSALQFEDNIGLVLASWAKNDSVQVGQPRKPSDDFVAQTITSKLTSGAIVVLGVLATVAATYYTLRDTWQHARLTPACFPWW